MSDYFFLGDKNEWRKVFFLSIQGSDLEFRRFTWSLLFGLHVNTSILYFLLGIYMIIYYKTGPDDLLYWRPLDRDNNGSIYCEGPQHVKCRTNQCGPWGLILKWNTRFMVKVTQVKSLFFCSLFISNKKDRSLRRLKSCIISFFSE